MILNELIFNISFSYIDITKFNKRVCKAKKIVNNHCVFVKSKLKRGTQLATTNTNFYLPKR
ncbi:hypothetical protein GCM10025767_17440 [Thalassotalea piscium]